MSALAEVRADLNRVVVSLSLSRLAEAVGNGFIIVAVPMTVAALPADSLPFAESTRIGIIVSLFGLVLAIAQPLVSHWSGQRGSLRRHLLMGTFAFSAVTALMSVATSYWQMLLLRTLQGLFMAFVVPSTLSLIALHAQAERRGAAMGFYGMARMVGFGLGPMLGGAVLLALDGPEAYLIAAVPGLISCLMVWFGVPPDQREEPVTSVAGTAAAVAAPDQVDPGIRPFLPLAFALFASACSLSAMSVLENAFMDRLHMTTFSFGIAFSALVLIRIFVDWPMGRLSDRIGRKRLIVPGLMALGPLTILMAYAPSAEALFVVRLAMGAAMACVSAPTFALAADRAPAKYLAARVSWVTAGFALGLAVGPLMTGVLADHVGFASPFWVMGGLAILAGLVVHMTAHEPPRPKPAPVEVEELQEELPDPA